MKKFLIMVLAAVLVFALWGCECSHTWQAATCTSGEVCSQCGETQGEPAGHTWTKATCDVPQTCSACGETQGEAGHDWQEATCRNAKTCNVCGLKEGTSLAHDYVFDKFVNDEMQYRCTVCSATTKQPMDRELYANHLIVGFWDLYAVQNGTALAMASNTTEVGAYLVANEDGTIQFHLEDGQALDVTMEYVDYEAIDLGGSYSVAFVTEDETRYEAVLTVQTGNSTQLTIAMGGNKSVILQLNPEIEEKIARTWYDTNHERLYFMDMKSDRTFTADFDGGISGTWHIKPIYQYYGMDAFNVALSYNMGDRPVVRNIMIIISSPSTAKGLAKLDDPMCSLTMQMFNDFVDQTQLNMQYLMEREDTYTVIPEDAAVILGNWICNDVQAFSFESGTSSRLDNPGYTAVFNEDGTFLIDKDTPVEGEWFYICTWTQFGENFPMFNLKTDDYFWYISFHVRESYYGLEFTYSESVGSDSTAYNFVKAE